MAERVEHMKRVMYAGGSFLTGDEIATVTLEMASALADATTAVQVDVPGLSESGELTEFSLLIGPASQMLTESIDGPEDLVDPEFVASMRERLKSVLRDSHSSVTTTEEVPPLTFVDDDVTTK
jgi:hypothetical protein